MADTLANIVAWAEALPPWQSDAVRRLLVQDRLTDADEDELFLMLKEAKGLADPKSPAPKPQPAAGGAISGAPKSRAKVTVKALQNISNVNALPPDAKLPIGHEGLTVIYGENASGKSGYARVFKRACKARDTEERILPNVFESAPPEPASATFKLSIDGGADQLVPWRDGENSPDVLGNILVFDSKCARLIVDEDNQMSYLPYGAHVFEALVRLLDRFRQRLQEERPTPKRPLFPQVPATTEAGRFLSELSPRSDLTRASVWTDADQNRLDTLTRQIARAELDDPRRHAEKLRNARRRVLAIVEATQRVDTSLSRGQEASLKEDVSKLLVAKEAFRIASQQFGQLKSELLPGFGEGAWQVLYKAAMEYSVTAAYPNMTFPYIGEGSKCVLCQQPLLDGAKKRMQQFRAFMEQSAKAHAEKVRDKLKREVQEIEGLDLAVPSQYSDVLTDLRGDHPAVIGQLEAFFQGMKARATQLKQACVQNDWSAVAPIPANPGDSLIKIANGLELKAQAIEKAGDPEQMTKLKAERQELAARKRLVDRMPDVRGHVGQVAEAAKYDACIRGTDSRPITVQGRDIISEALTPQLMSALRHELAFLGFSSLRLDLRRFGQKGETRYRLELRDRMIGGAPLSEILSEGEHRIVAIAGFLAELTVAQHTSPIVFDDPVSSLDHRFAEKIAERLVKESCERQVIVFTHDMPFLLHLKTKAGEFGAEAFARGEPFGAVKLTALSTRRLRQVSGVLESGLPWKAKKLAACLHELEVDLSEFKSLYADDMKEYNRRAEVLYSRLREAWESFVEQVLFNNVITRFVNAVKTQSLKEVSVDCVDTVTVDLAMTKCSNLMTGHSTPLPMDDNRPPPKRILEDIKHLREFAGKVKDKHSDAKAQHDIRLATELPDVG